MICKLLRCLFVHSISADLSSTLTLQYIRYNFAMACVFFASSIHVIV